MLKRNVFVIVAAFVTLFAVSFVFAGEIDTEFKTKLLIMSPDSVVSALIFIQDKVSLESLVAQLDEANVDRLTRHYTVITALKDKAHITQGPFLTYLGAQKEAREFKAYEAFWIDNVISVRGTARALLAAENIPNMSTPYKIKEPVPIILRGSKPNKTTYLRGSTSIIAVAESNLKHINAHRVWEMGLHGESRLVCIFDSGTDMHVAFANRWRGNQSGVPASAAWFDPFNNTTSPRDFDTALGVVDGTARMLPALLLV